MYIFFITFLYPLKNCKQSEKNKNFLISSAGADSVMGAPFFTYPKIPFEFQRFRVAI